MAFGLSWRGKTYEVIAYCASCKEERNKGKARRDCLGCPFQCDSENLHVAAVIENEWGAKSVLWTARFFLWWNRSLQNMARRRWIGRLIILGLLYPLKQLMSWPGPFIWWDPSPWLGFYGPWLTWVCGGIAVLFILDIVVGSTAAVLLERRRPLNFRSVVATLTTSYCQVILAFALLFTLLPCAWFNSNLLDSQNLGTSFCTPLYFSLVTGATVGYGDFAPVYWVAKLLVCVEVLLGIYLLSVALAAAVSQVGETTPRKYPSLIDVLVPRTGAEYWPGPGV